MITVKEIRAVLLEDEARVARGWPTLLDVGQVGELIIEALHPEWRRAPRLTPGYDFLDPADLRIQVKTWGVGARRTFDNYWPGSCDRVIVIELLPHAEWRMLCDLAAARFEAETTYRNHRGQASIRRNQHRIEDWAA